MTIPFLRARTCVAALAGLMLALSSVAVAQSSTIPPDSPAAAALRRAEASVQNILSVPNSQRNFQNTIGAIDDLLARIELDTNMTMFLAYVSTDAAERERGQQAEQDVTNWLIDLAKREDLYRAVQAYADTRPRLAGEQERLLAHTLRDYRRAGMNLPAAQRETLAGVEKELNKLSIEFETNIREDETRVPLTRDELAGMSDEYLDGLTRTATGMYLVGMSYPEFLPIMDLCEKETTRNKVWLAYKRRGGQSNVRLLEKILALRAEQAQLLGYAHPADYEIEVKMAKNADNVMAFYDKLRPMVRKKALRDYDEFVTAKRNHTGNRQAELHPWDFSFYQNKLKKDTYAVDGEKVREYFPLDRVIDGLFSVTQSLFGLRYEDITAQARTNGRPLWHEDVRVFRVFDDANGKQLGEFYLDLHPRDNKYGHAAQWGLAQHKVWSDGRVTKPVAALVCNFTKPTAQKPSLLSHDEVETFFHEFGHCLHTILSEARYWQFSGTAVERDFVEAPSQMLENWVWSTDALGTFAQHYKTGAPFPQDLLDGMLAGRYLGSGMMAERQFYYGLFDMNCHLRSDGVVDTTQLAHDLWGEQGSGVELYAGVPETHFQAAFGHLTGYQAGYYGYQWSLVYASDMFQRFKELGMLDPAAGRYYRQKILSRGGTQDGLDLVRGYLGREPEMDAYLRHLGLDE
ncbi:MAG: Zn-dependent oligopeptidase [Phycisphaerae bacterium]|nr:Zn-dependent oligopeptidase [Phycisphaerae bacterium]NNF41595.1 Zn-dependent oligopeptidase [Phycisphaerales bacterium]